MLENLKKTFFHACAYSTVITLIFFLFARIFALDNLSVSVGRYALIVAFSFLVAAAEMLLYIEKIPKYLAYVIHFSSLFCAFLVIFIIVNGGDEFKASFVFAALAIFSLLYALIFGSVVLLKRLFSKRSEKPTAKAAPKKEEYKNRFS